MSDGSTTQAGRARARARLSLPRLVVLVAAVLAGSSGLGAGPAAAAPRPPAADTSTIGPLFLSAGTTEHYCTASVVDSPHRDLLVTAAHCVFGTGSGIVFAPGYHDGHEPYGTWRVVAAYGAPAWTESQDPQDDAAFLVVAPRTINGRTVDVQQVTGGNRLGRAPAARDHVTVVGYALGAGGDPIICSRKVSTDDGFPQFACPGYVDGTSGGPWLTGTGTGTGTRGRTVVGVVGGLHQGGCRSDVSYSSAFGNTVEQTYLRATAGATASTFPIPGSDGCGSSP